MKTFSRFLLFFVLLEGFLEGVLQAEPVNASLAATRGEVATNGTKAQIRLPAPLKSGATVKTGVNSGAIVLPVSGQTIFVDQTTTFQIKESDMTAAPGSGWTRHAVCSLNSGHVHCSIASPKTGSSALSLITPQATLSAHGTSWSTWSDNSGMHTAVYAGVVTVNFGGIDYAVQPGQVVTIVGQGDAATLEVLDLKTGIITRYAKGSSSGQAELATPSQISAARNLFASGLGAFTGTATEADKMALSLIINQINQTLAKNQLPSIDPPVEWELWPNWTNIERNIAPTASSSQPGT
jgi:hypothetical protein